MAGAGEGGWVEMERGEIETSRVIARAIALVPFVVVQMMSLPCTALRENSRGELPRSKPSGFTAWRSPARMAVGSWRDAERAASTVWQGTILRAPLARA